MRFKITDYEDGTSTIRVGTGLYVDWEGEERSSPTRVFSTRVTEAINNYNKKTNVVKEYTIEL